ncbi:MAG: NUDIX domain-containing protein [Candidatus Omnitrophota bacterium]
MKRQFGAGGVVISRDDGMKVLLIKDRYGRWTWPKGHVEEGETDEETALREITEETGLKHIRIIEKIGSQEYWFTLKDEKIFKTVNIFLVESLGQEKLKIQKEEVLLAEWFSPPEALDRIEYEGSKEILEKAIEAMGD